MATLKQGIIKTVVTLTAMECPVCGVHYGLDEGFRQRAKEDSKKSWYCTNGHSLVFTETDADRERKLREAAEKRLAAEQGWSQRLSDHLEAERKAHSATKGQLTRTRHRIQAGVCPDCKRHFTNVERHMQTKHGVPT